MGLHNVWEPTSTSFGCRFQLSPKSPTVLTGPDSAQIPALLRAHAAPSTPLMTSSLSSQKMARQGVRASSADLFTALVTVNAMLKRGGTTTGATTRNHIQNDVVYKSIKTTEPKGRCLSPNPPSSEPLCSSARRPKTSIRWSLLNECTRNGYQYRSRPQQHLVLHMRRESTFQGRICECVRQREILQYKRAAVRRQHLDRRVPEIAAVKIFIETAFASFRPTVQKLHRSRPVYGVWGRPSWEHSETETESGTSDIFDLDNLEDLRWILTGFGSIKDWEAGTGERWPYIGPIRDIDER
ncbi:hypothetical protein B0H11DRAFT_1923966 [Mycena galericulata]|nr:hypothetical protein B0H11DRAFT_1923966 [Mycena galericulata]